MDNNIKKIMEALDNVLSNTVWINEKNQITSLADELHIEKLNGEPKSIEDLSRHSLVGAMLSLQIRSDNFEISADSLSDTELGLKVKQMVFSEANKLLQAKKQTNLKVA